MKSFANLHILATYKICTVSVSAKKIKKREDFKKINVSTEVAGERERKIWQAQLSLNEIYLTSNNGGI